MTKLSKILRIVAAAAFLTALAVNVKVTLTDPFVGMSGEAVAQTTDTITITETISEVVIVCGKEHAGNCWDEECHTVWTPIGPTRVTHCPTFTGYPWMFCIPDAPCF